MKKMVVVLLTLCLASCVIKVSSPVLSYVPPAVVDHNSYSKELDKSYDMAWKDLINHLSVSSFAIDNFEKDSGLITLSFGHSNIAQFVDCGMMDGVNYVDWLKSTAQKTSLTGRMNVSLREIDENTSNIRVNARYILSSGSTTWAFDSGSSDTVFPSNPANGTIPSRTCVPTYYAEEKLINNVNSL
jgi:hypothetical protein